MPSAEPAPTPDPVGDTRAAANDAGARIIPLTPRMARAAQRSGGATDMPHPQPAPDDGGGEEAILRTVAEHLELRLGARHLTLADPKVLSAVQAALEVAQGVVDGAQVRDIVDAEQSAEIAGLLAGVMRAAQMGHEQG